MFDYDKVTDRLFKTCKGILDHKSDSVIKSLKLKFPVHHQSEDKMAVDKVMDLFSEIENRVIEIDKSYSRLLCEKLTLT